MQSKDLILIEKLPLSQDTDLLELISSIPVGVSLVIPKNTKITLTLKIEELLS